MLVYYSTSQKGLEGPLFQYFTPYLNMVERSSLRVDAINDHSDVMESRKAPCGSLDERYLPSGSLGHPPPSQGGRSMRGFPSKKLPENPYQAYPLESKKWA